MRAPFVAAVLVIVPVLVASAPGAPDAGVARADSSEPAPRPVDVSAYRSSLLLFKDALGVVYIAKPRPDAEVFVGTTKAVYQQVSVGASANGAAWSVATWAPRVPNVEPGAFGVREDGVAYKYCGASGGQANADLTPVTGAAVTALLDKVTFFAPLTLRRAVNLARDDRGTYYYVDRLRGGAAYRVFVGPKGAMKQLPLKNVVDDGEGRIFSTRGGERRLVASNKATDATAAKRPTVWIKGRKRVELVTVDVDASSHLILRDLGIYGALGTLCDDL